MKVKNVYKDIDMASQLVRATEGSAGIDLRSISDVTIEPGEIKPINTGVAFEIPENYVGLLFVRSSIGNKKHLTLTNAVGVIDSDYRGEILAKLLNTGKETQTIEKNERFCQLVLVPYLSTDLEVVEELTETVRGEGGIGSTGTK